MKSDNRHQTDTQEKPANQTQLVERAHDSVEAMVRTMKEVIEDESTSKTECDRECHELDDSTRNILENTFLCRKERQKTKQETRSQRVHEPTSTFWISC